MKTMSDIFITEYVVELTKLADLVASHAQERGVNLDAEVVYDVIEDEYDLAYDNHDSSFCCRDVEEAQERYDKDNSTFNLIILEISKMYEEGIVPEAFNIHNEW